MKIHGLAATGRGSGVITGGELYYGFYSLENFLNSSRYGNVNEICGKRLIATRI